jgi:hypothetical protein
MTPSEQAKTGGLKSLQQMVEMTEVPRQTLVDWHKSRPVLFKIIIFGCQKVLAAKVKKGG